MKNDEYVIILTGQCSCHVYELVIAQYVSLKSNKMKQSIFSVLFLIAITINGYAQCGNTKNVDDFDSSATITTKTFTIMNTPLSFIVGKQSWNVEMNYFKRDDTLGIYLEHSTEISPSNIKYIYFKFSDGEVIKKTEPIEYKKQNEWGTKSKGTSFILTKEELLKFTQVDVDKIKFEFRHFPDYQVVEKDVNKNKAKQYMKFAKCLYGEL